MKLQNVAQKNIYVHCVIIQRQEKAAMINTF